MLLNNFFFDSHAVIDLLIQSLYYDIYNHDVDYNLAEPSILKIIKISAKSKAWIIEANAVNNSEYRILSKNLTADLFLV